MDLLCKCNDQHGFAVLSPSYNKADALQRNGKAVLRSVC